MLITPFYGAIFAFILVVLSVRTLRLRRKLKVAIGHGNQPTLERAMRAHANFCEYVPMTLLLIFFLESLTATTWWIHLLGISLLIGRAVHAFGVSQVSETYLFRVFGMAMTFTVIVFASVRILMAYLLQTIG